MVGPSWNAAQDEERAGGGGRRAKATEGEHERTPSARRSWRVTGKESAGTRKRRLGRAKRARRRTHGSSERERQLAAFSRDDAPNRRAAAGSVSPVAAGRPASYLCPSLLFYVS